MKIKLFCLMAALSLLSFCSAAVFGRAEAAFGRSAGIFFLIALFAAAALIVSKILQRFYRGIVQIDLEHPEDASAPEEISLLVSRIRQRNESIALQFANMRKTQNEFAAITDHMREGLILLDKEGHILSCNASAEQLLHAKPGMNQNVLTLRRDAPFREAVEQALNGAYSEAVDGKNILLIASPVMDQGKIQGAVLFFSDVTEQENREKLRREFSANVSHELKTPLMAVSGYAEIMAGGVAKPEDMPAFAQRIYQEAQRLIRLVDDIMMISKLDEKNIPAKEPVELNWLIADVLPRVESAAADRGITLIFETEQEKAVVSGIRHVLDEMIYNLLDNAVKYNIQNGSVRIAAKSADKGVLLAVCDTGVGIPYEEQGRVFERFYRVDKSRSGAISGTGLGLSIVKHGAALHNAQITVTSDGKSGTCVEILFLNNREENL